MGVDTRTKNKVSKNSVFLNAGLKVMFGTLGLSKSLLAAAAILLSATSVNANTIIIDPVPGAHQGNVTVTFTGGTVVGLVSGPAGSLTDATGFYFPLAPPNNGGNASDAASLLSHLTGGHVHERRAKHKFQ